MQVAYSRIFRLGLNSAIAVGDLHSGTRAVVIAVGINDYGPFGVREGFQPWDKGKMRADYVRNLLTAARRFGPRFTKQRSWSPACWLCPTRLLVICSDHSRAPNAPGSCLSSKSSCCGKGDRRDICSAASVFGSSLDTCAG